jgi:spermidine synthase
MARGKLELIVFITGATIMILELIGSRLMAPFVGNSLFTWTSLISVVLASLSIGYYLGGKFADKKPNMMILSLLLLLTSFFIGLIPLFSNIVLESSRKFGLKYGPLVASFALFTIPNILLGMVTPYAVKLGATKLKRIGKTTGNLYAISTVGSIVGTLLTGYFLIPNLGIRESLFTLSLVLALMGVISFGRKGITFLITVLLLGLLRPPSTGVSRGKVIYEKDSPYYHIQVVDLNKNIRYLKTDLLTQSTISLNSTELLDIYYKYQSLIYAKKPGVKKALYMGLGGGAMVMDLYRNSNASIDVVEIDPVIIEVAKKFFNVSENERIKIYNEDARFFLKNSNEKYDMIVEDAFGSYIAIPYHLASLEAAVEMKEHLTDDGAVFINIISAIEGSNSSVFKSIYKTFSYVFPNVYVFHTDFEDLVRYQCVVLILDSKKEKYSGVDLIGYFNESIEKSVLDEIVGNYYENKIETDAYPVLTDNYNPLDNFVASLLK